jgi:hypothetical protein
MTLDAEESHDIPWFFLTHTAGVSLSVPYARIVSWPHDLVASDDWPYLDVY